jgi:phage shock protein PspC (stress-responsive transcriptional regulator)
VSVARKLHRVAGAKKIAGVCAGLGEYFDLDPVLFRLLFVISVFFGGVGLLVYVLMWIMVPEKPAAEGQPPATARRLHLSSTDRKIAGVCGGLGEWLDVDPVFVRVAFVLLALACGFGLLLYVLLWLLAPRASAAPAAN